MFTSLEDLSARIDDPELDVTPDDFLVLQNAGPLSPSGMPEAGYLPIPQKLARAGVKDMVRISDARMSGTAYGTIVLHVTPDAAIGGPLAKVRNGDRIRLSVKERRIDLLVAARGAGAPPGARRRRCPSAATPGSTAARSCKPTAAAISISCASTRSGWKLFRLGGRNAAQRTLAQIGHARCSQRSPLQQRGHGLAAAAGSRRSDRPPGA